MHIEVVDCLDDYDRLRDAWTEVYAADRAANTFVSWLWLRSWLEVTPYKWFVLAARPEPSSPYVAFLPLAANNERRHGIELVRELHLASKPLADYTGLVCHPANEAQTLPAFARYIREELTWDRFFVTDAIDPRLESLLQQVCGSRDVVHEREPLACPWIPLSKSWERHLSESMSAKSRYDVRRAFRNVEQSGTCRVTEPTAQDLDFHLDTLINLWKTRWGERRVADVYRHVFRRAFENGTLWLRILWDGDQPMAAVSAFTDPIRKTIYQHIMAFDRRFAKRSPGRALTGYSIRDAIDRNFDCYDFLLGAEDYKYSFGARQRVAYRALAAHPSLRCLLGSALIRSEQALSRRRRDLRRFASAVANRLVTRRR